MAPLLDVEHLGIIDDRTHIVVFFRCLREGKKTVHTGNEVGIDLYLRNILLHRSYQFIEELGFENQNFLIGTENLLFIFLQFLSNISLCLSKRLLANPVFRHLVLEGIAHL